MPPVTPQAATSWIEVANAVSIVFLLLAVIVGGYFRKWRWDREVLAALDQLDKMTKERDMYRDLFHRSIGLYTEAVTGKLIVPRKDVGT